MKRAATLVILVVFAAAMAWWVTYVPYQPQRLFAAIPVGADLVSVHEAPAQRWRDMARNPLVQAALQWGGVDGVALQAVLEDPDVGRWVDRLAARQVVAAHVPRLGPTGQDAWVAASWIGAEERRLRWLARLELPSDVRVHRTPHGRVYVLDTGDGKRWLSLALADGMLLACYATDPFGVMQMQRRLHGGAAALPVEAALASVAAAPDRGVGLPGRGAREVAVGLDRIDEKGLTVRAVGTHPAAMSLVPDDGGLGSLDVPARLLGDAPEAVAVFPAAGLAERMSAGIVPEAAIAGRLLDAVGASATSDAAFAAVFGGDDASRIGKRFSLLMGRGLKVPVLVAGVRTGDPDRALRAMAHAVDEFNALHRLGLIPVQSLVGERLVYGLEGTAGGFYDHLARDERLGYAVCDGWLIVASHAGKLTRLVARYDRAEAREEAAVAAWPRRVRSAGAFAWVNLASAGDTFNQATAMYSLFLPRTEAGYVERERLRRIQEGVARLAPLGAASLWGWSTNGAVEVELTAGQ